MAYQQLVEDHHKLMFTDNVKMVAQQMTNPLDGAVTVVPASGEAQDIADLVAKIEYEEGDDYERRNPDNVPNRTRRWLVRPNVIQSGQLITKEEQFDQSKDPTSPLMKAHTAAVVRGRFDRMLGVKRQTDGTFAVADGGILGRVHEGKTPTSTKALPAGNYIAADFGSPGTDHGLTAEKLRAGTEAMELEEFGLETELMVYGLISPKQKTDLIKLALATKTSLDPFEVEAIREGKPGRLLGINWRFTNRLPYDSDGNRLCPLWFPGNIVVGEWQGIEGQIFNDSSAKNLPRMLIDAYPAAGRVEDGGVRVIRCAEA